MTAHTPGPWELHGWGDANYEVLAAGATVCNVPGFDDDTVDFGRAEADARLIAAAPELLKALDELVGRVIENDGRGDLVDNALAAVAKAKGDTKTTGWTEAERASLYRAIYAKRAELDIEAFEEWLAGLGITWVELDSETTDAPKGTVAVWEGPGFENEARKQCWAVPDAVAAKLLGAANEGKTR